MRKITQEDFEKMKFKVRRKPEKTPIRKAVEELGVGEFLKIEKDEWVRKSPVSQVMQILSHTLKRKFY
jgi:hypothetical protein